MSSRIKVIFLASTIVVPFLIYCIVYYTPMIRNAPFRSTEFVSLQIKWGLGNDLVNSYDSKARVYQYLNSKDSLVKVRVTLRKNDILYLHSKANELGFWNLPDLIANPGTDLAASKQLRYVMQMNYKRKSKTVVFVADFNQNTKLRDVAAQMQKLMIKTINNTEERYNN